MNRIIWFLPESDTFQVEVVGVTGRPEGGAQKVSEGLYLSLANPPSGKRRAPGKLELEDIDDAKYSEYMWAKSEIESITEQLDKIADGSTRATATEEEWRAYREALREYATVDENGVYSLRTEKPTRPE